MWRKRALNRNSLFPPALLAVLGLMAGLAKASTTPCSGSYTLDALAQPGCEQVDAIFNGFNTLEYAGNGPSMSDISASFSGITADGPITDSFTSADWILSSAGTSSVFVFNDVQLDESAVPDSFIIGFDVNPGTLTLPTTCAGSGGCDSVAIYTNFCTNEQYNSCYYGTANFGQVIYLDTAGAGIKEEYCYADCSGAGSFGNLSLTFDSSLDVTSMFIQNWVTVTNYDSQTVGISGYSNDFFEDPAPEPGTFALLAAALSVAGIIRIRRRRA